MQLSSSGQVQIFNQNSTNNKDYNFLHCNMVYNNLFMQDYTAIIQLIEVLSLLVEIKINKTYLHCNIPGGIQPTAEGGSSFRKWRGRRGRNQHNKSSEKNESWGQKRQGNLQTKSQGKTQGNSSFCLFLFIVGIQAKFVCYDDVICALYCDVPGSPCLRKTGP